MLRRVLRNVSLSKVVSSPCSRSTAILSSATRRLSCAAMKSRLPRRLFPVAWSSSWFSFSGGWFAGAAMSVMLFATTALCGFYDKKKDDDKSKASAAKKESGDGMPQGHVPRPDLPVYSIADIKKHSEPTSPGGMWVTYKGGVYNISEFLVGHPGGSRIAMAGGMDLAIFFHIYRMHYQPHILKFLEKYRIGSTTAQDAITMETETTFQDPYEFDPLRPNSDLLHTIERPFCGEPVLERLGETFYTPNDLHYVRNHLPVPEIAADEWELTVQGNGIPTPKKFTLKDLKEKFQHHEVSCTLQCAGNRREDFQSLQGHDVFISPQWRVAAISNAKYKGVYVRDVLKYCGLDVDRLYSRESPSAEFPNIRHVLYDGSDSTEDGIKYGISIPIEKAVNPRGDAMLVWEMNGEPLPPDHGAPVRTLTPGHVGNKSCKFVESITVTDKEATKPWHSKSYRNFPPDVSFENDLSNWGKLTPDQLSKGPICQLMPVQSLITFPPPDSVVGVGKNFDGAIKLRGVSWSGNGTGMARVDVSGDGGHSWTAADFLEKPKDVRDRETFGRFWSWSPFEKTLTLSNDVVAKLRKGEKVQVEFTSKGIDNQFNTQPESVLPYYNARGVVVNSMYRVPVTLDPGMAKGEVLRPAGEKNPPTGGHFLRQWNKHGWDSPEARWHEEIVSKAEAQKQAAKTAGGGAGAASK